MSLSALPIQYYPYGLYQPGTPSYDPKIILIQPTLNLYDFLLLPPRDVTTNITALDEPISSITYISHIPSKPHIDYQCPMDSCSNIYVFEMDNDYPTLSTTAVQLTRDKQKLNIYSSVKITLEKRHPSYLNPLEEHHAFF